MTYYQVGHIPSVDICFPTDDRDEVTRDTYIFKSMLSNCLHADPSIAKQINENERLNFSLKDEIRRHREYQDFSQSHIEQEQQ